MDHQPPTGATPSEAGQAARGEYHPPGERRGRAPNPPPASQQRFGGEGYLICFRVGPRWLAG